MEMVDCLKRRIPRFPTVLALAVLGFGSEEPQVLFKNVLDAEEDVAEAGLTLPRSPVGKVLKRTIRDRYWVGRDRAV
jgi:hypothetical protein